MARPHFSFSKRMGENSRASTEVYSITHQATSNITECGFHHTMARQMFQGLPRSNMRAQITSM